MSYDRGASSFRLGRLSLVSTPFMYMEQKCTHSCIMYASAIDPSGRALFFTKDFNLRKYHSMGYIQRYCTGPPTIASRAKWTKISRKKLQSSIMASEISAGSFPRMDCGRMKNILAVSS